MDDIPTAKQLSDGLMAYFMGKSMSPKEAVSIGIVQARLMDDLEKQSVSEVARARDFLLDVDARGQCYSDADCGL